jgi:spermidine synthase
MTNGAVLTVHELHNSGSKPSWYFGFFVISGFCGLVYEVVWLRLAMSSFGVTTALASIVISMFMAGLGLGSWGAGVLARRLLAGDGKRALRFYAAAELLVGFSSVAVPLQLKVGRALVQHLGNFAAWQTSQYYLLIGLWIAITLLPWCACMGSTFPLLMAVIRQSAGSDSERSFSYLYIANVLGALLGTIASAFVLIELLGFHGTLYIAGILNTILSVAAFTLSFRIVSSTSVKKLSQPATEPRLYGYSGSVTLLFLFTSGLVSMGMEVIWIRQLTPYQGTVVYAFAGILATYLLATVSGSHQYRCWVLMKSPNDSAPFWSLLALFAVIPLIAADPHLRLGQLQPVPIVRLASIWFFCSLTGFLTPLLVDSWSSGDPDRAGTAYAVNVAGSLVGPLLAGFWLLPWVGERKATIVLTIPLFAIAALVTLRNSTQARSVQSVISPKVKFVFATTAAVAICAMTHDYETAYAARVVKRDYAATVIATGDGFRRLLLVNGVGMTWLTPMTKYMAHLPLAFMSRPPRNGLVICFGMGTTFRSMLSWGIPTTAVDLVPSVPLLFGYYHEDALQLTKSPLARIVVDDGRRFLDGSTQTYDVIVVDPPPPLAAAGSSLLYSTDFYSVVKKHLQKDGILQVWCPAPHGSGTVAILKALMQSFPYVRGFTSLDDYGIHFLASNQPLPSTSSAALASRLPSHAASDFVEWGPETNPEQQFQLVLSRELILTKVLDEAPRVPPIQDDQPVNEYYLLRAWFHFDR